MRALFGDTTFFVAFLDPDEGLHDLAVEYMDGYLGRIVTTVWVVTELGNFLSKTRHRRLFMPFVRQVRMEDRLRILPWDPQVF